MDRRWVCAGLASAFLVAMALVGCSAGAGPSGGSSPSATQHATDETGDTDGSGDSMPEPRDVGFEELMDDPAGFVGERVRVTGSVFFLAECPPPGAGDAPCVLLGYLAEPERRTLIAADAAQALALAEGGKRLSCPEGSQPTPACGDWVGEATYSLEGEVQRQVLGGRETSLVQLDVVEKSAPEPW